YADGADGVGAAGLRTHARATGAEGIVVPVSPGGARAAFFDLPAAVDGVARLSSPAHRIFPGESAVSAIQPAGDVEPPANHPGFVASAVACLRLSEPVSADDRDDRRHDPGAAGGV